MRPALFMCSILLSGAALASRAGDIDFSQGVFIVNEDWYGHQNSTVNYLLPDAAEGECWHYRVVQSENPGMELGCTNQFGAIFDGRFYLIAKQAKDPGAAIQGGRITVADASTMKILHQAELIDPSGTPCDGRAFIGVDSHKGYISTSNGVWILNLDTYSVTGQIEGTGNSTPSNIYKSQCGTMVEAGGHIFVAHQQLGLLVIDPVIDRLVATVPVTSAGESAGIGSVVKAKDGSLWVSVAKNTSGHGQALPYLIKVDPSTLETTLVAVPEGMHAPSNSWYAWTPDSFCASAVSNTLYWSGGASSWFNGQQIFRYDIDSGSLSKIIDLADDGAGWKLYGCSMRPHPVTGEIYMSLYRDFSSTSYITRRCTPDGETIREYAMIENYWFPSLPVFPESDEASTADVPVAAPGGMASVISLGGTVLWRGPAESLPLPGGVYILVQGATAKKIFIK